MRNNKNEDGGRRRVREMTIKKDNKTDKRLHFLLLFSLSHFSFAFVDFVLSTNVLCYFLFLQIL